eukprot:226882_1
MLPSTNMKIYLPDVNHQFRFIDTVNKCIYGYIPDLFSNTLSNFKIECYIPNITSIICIKNTNLDGVLHFNELPWNTRPTDQCKYYVKCYAFEQCSSGCRIDKYIPQLLFQIMVLYIQWIMIYIN